MTACHIAEVDGEYACTVHCHYLPCPHDGEHASLVPMHTDSSQPLGDVLAYWVAVCAGARPMYVHQGLFSDDREHIVARDQSCWCHPQLVPAGTAHALRQCGLIPDEASP